MSDPDAAGGRTQAPEAAPAPAPAPQALRGAPEGGARSTVLQALETSGQGLEAAPPGGDPRQGQSAELQAPAAPVAPARARRETLSDVEARQPWQRYRLHRPVAAEATEITAAQRANTALGFTGRAIDQILERLDLSRSHRRSTFTREGTEAIRAFQQAQGLRGGALPAADGAAPEPDQATGPATGVLDEATLVALDVAALSGRRLATQGARHYRTHGAWSRLTDEAFAERRQALITRFQLTEADLAQETAGRGRGARTVTTASPAFLHRVYAWQLWQWRGQRPPNGLLAEEDLQALGVLAAAPEAPTTAGPETEADATTDEEAELPPPEPPAGADAPEDHGADLRLMRRSILEYLRNFNALRSVQPAAERDARRHALGEPWEGQLITYRAQLDAWQISGLDTNVLNRRTARGGQESVANWARRWVRSLDQFLTGTTTAPGAGGQAETVRGTAPVSRPADYQQGDDVGVHTVEEGEAWLGERDLTLREQSIEAQGWDPRLNHADGADEPVQEIAGRAVPALQSLRTRMSQAAHDLESALAREDDPSREHLRRVYTEIMGRDFAPPPTVRTPWRVNLPRESAARIAAWTPGQVLSHARQLRGRLAAEARRLEPEIRRNANYQGSIHMVNPHGVVVDLHRSGVDVCWGEGTPMEIEHFNLDPVFATAMFRYLETLRGMGVTKLWTSGFLRPHGTAISVLDAHPLGMACDITGFQFGSDPDGLIHLRGGFPMEPGNSRYDHWQRGHSDWYDERGTFNGRTHREIMLGMAEILPHYFGRIIGPGHNETHMNHFHVELFGNRRAGPALRAISEYGDMPEWTHPRADRLDPGWREGGR